MARETMQATMMGPLKSGRVENWDNFIWSLATADIPLSDHAIPQNTTACELPWLASSRRSRLLEYFSTATVRHKLQCQLDAHLTNRNKSKPTNRLGIYFERLWLFAFLHHPDYELLHHNLPLRQNGRTLGELDFVVRHLPSHCCEHWEMAVKFYLQLPDKIWIGPGLKDRLDIKLARMSSHQLPLIKQPGVKPLLRDHKLTIDRQWALMPGRLFKPLTDMPQVPSSLESPLSWWADFSHFQDFFLNYNPTNSASWIALPKSAWLAQQRIIDNTERAHNLESLLDAISQRGLTEPLCVAATGSRGEITRGFVVADDWCHRAQMTLNQ
ncbi:DUF1853 family protein [Microbulbifer sp. OS29]|uniref:DUF1853 family protein n=1 Tax=Microbulbifer okhotskensis TaxID=2926617 RepID=A0A9X2ENG1_9GAMM|nr:DUF1853 family protein [Microbulbifer okhotskensis]MCO1335447.1 DUF1853 family protein [Microbulbifer okhotskensis]